MQAVSSFQQTTPTKLKYLAIQVEFYQTQLATPKTHQNHFLKVCFSTAPSYFSKQCAYTLKTPVQASLL